MKNQPRILIIDDQEFQQALLRELVESRGFFSRCLSSGVGVLDVIGEFKPDLILLDMELPDLSGDRVIRNIRSKFNASVLPVIIISGKDSSEKIVEMLKLGANDYITKPFEIEVTIARIELHLRVMTQHKELVALKERSVIRDMVTTYNHEINNPLSIALAELKYVRKNDQKEVRFENMEMALKRIAEITHKISDLLEKDQMETEDYVGDGDRLYKLK